MLGDMTYPSEPTGQAPATTRIATAEPDTAKPPAKPDKEPRQQSRLTQAVAWVGIVAGIVFIVAVVFGTGFFLGVHSGGGHHHHGGGGWERPGMMFHHHGGQPGMG